jgi:cyclohexyl-isocyanide hydratase
VDDIKSERRAASNRNQWAASRWNAWADKSESAAGLLHGKHATTHWAALPFLAAFGAIPVAERVVRDGNLFTGGGVTAGIDFALTMAAELAGQEAAEAVQLQIEYNPAPPFTAGSPATAPSHVLASVAARLAKITAARQDIVRRVTTPLV